MVSKSGCEPAFAGSCCAGDYHGDAATDVFAGAELRYVRSVKSAYGVVCQFVDLHLIAEPGVFEQACVAVGAAHVVLSMKENAEAVDDVERGSLMGLHEVLPCLRHAGQAHLSKFSKDSFPC